ncbi:hypothetical protein A1O1_08048 [Capronia coronata CBS 617.96]|uniref:Zn(2)-C6 fungal-type domain-containing protein n=1 Tax=Capronia coronata CBS 617.96 TaxID=1182541 RepID=W9XYG1_9EURO|nr:uncharacterized protein A1O1_08048 [Capronia coronata CBS 617.96]EXJ81981.1 hypothetical protein A1O1_08048 [Capronia coronata CBS 617.96]
MIATQKRRRSGTGCFTCKIRRVKCDESRPSCNRCSSTGRKCDGYPAPKQPAPVALLVVMNVPAPTLDRDHEARTRFHFFSELCAPSLLNYGGQSFWNRLVLQAGHADEGIKHLILAASCLAYHKQGVSEPASPMDDPVFLSHYGRGLRTLAQTRNADPAVVLIACLLLILCDEFQQNRFAARQHIVAGRRILACCHHNRSIRRSATVDEVAHIFSRLGLVIGELNEPTQPQHLRWPLLGRHRMAEALDLQTPPKPPLQEGMTSIQEAVASLQRIASQCTALRIAGQPPATRFHTVPHLTDQLNDWLDQFNWFAAQMYPEQASASRTELHLLRTYHVCLHVLSRCAPFRQESAFDIYAGDLEYLMVKAQLLMPHTSVRLIPILFLVATRYRDASFRRRATEMLDHCGLDGQFLSTIASVVLTIEERDVDEPIVCSDIPEENRIRLFGLGRGINGASHTLLFNRAPYTELAPVEHVWFPMQSITWTNTQRSRHASHLLDDVLNFNFSTFWNEKSPTSTEIQDLEIRMELSEEEIVSSGVL